MEITVRRDVDRLYRRLPAMYREADAERGYPLRALLRLVGEQADLLHQDVQQLWDNFFIETCARWAIPYIGELVANTPLHDVDAADAGRTAEALFGDLAGPNLRTPAVIRRRADVTKTIHYRRRKGTPPMLEELARDVTGWAVHAVEFFQQLTWTQHLNHLRPASLDAPDVRRVDVGDRVQGPFDETSHAVDVRPIGQAEGWFNIPNIGFFLWRLRSYPVERALARQIGGTTWRYTFSPLGNSAPLFAAWLREGDEAGLATERHVPAPIRPAAFFEELERIKVTTPAPTHTDHYGDPADDPTWSFAVFEDGILVPPADITCANLDGWTNFLRASQDKIAIDVRHGRLTVGQLRPAREITVSYHYGFSADLGGGPYDRTKWLVREEPGQMRLTVGVLGTHTTLDLALAAWRALAAPRPDTVITILENGTFSLTGPLVLDAAGSLVIQADSGIRPHVRLAAGELEVGDVGAGSGSALTLSGLLVEGGLHVTQDIQRLRLLHTTLVPGRAIAEETVPSGLPSIDVAAGVATPINTALHVEVAFSITGPLRIPAHAAGLWLLDAVVDGIGGTAIGETGSSSGPVANIERSTILGGSSFRKLPLASETIFTARVTVAQQQEGCVRFSYVPLNSATPRQYRCQPALEIAAQPTVPEERIASWLHPRFEAVQYGLPGYVQLRRTTPVQILAGGADGAEMGAFNHLKQPQRETNLRVRLGEYLPFGLEAGFVYVT